MTDGGLAPDIPRAYRRRIGHAERLVAAGLKLKHLLLLSAIADLGRLQDAAARLGLAQSAASRLLGEMEAIIGGDLMRREARGLRPTPLGEAMIRHARSVVLALGRAGDDILAARTGGRSALAIGVLASCIAYPLQPALSDFAGAFSVVIADPEGLAEGLLDGRLDVAIGRLPQGGATDVFAGEFLCEDWLVALARPGHPALTGPAALARSVFLLPGEHSRAGRLAREALAGLGIAAPAIAGDADVPGLAVALASTRDLVAIVGQGEARNGGLQPVPAIGRIPLPAVQAWTLAGRPAHPALAAFIARMRTGAGGQETA